MKRLINVQYPDPDNTLPASLQSASKHFPRERDNGQLGNSQLFNCVADFLSPTRLMANTTTCPLRQSALLLFRFVDLRPQAEKALGALWPGILQLDAYPPGIALRGMSEDTE